MPGPESLLRQSSTLVNDVRGDGFYEGGDNGDAIEAHEWKCVRTINGTSPLTYISKTCIKMHYCGVSFWLFILLYQL